VAQEADSGNDHRSNGGLANIVASLEPDQLIAAKTKYHWPRRKLTGAQILLFWALRIYLIFMLGVVIYQIWHAVR
jgi:hypothetical protein